MILAVIVLALWLKQDDLIRWQLKSQIENNTGTQARIGVVQSDLPAGKVVVREIELSDPDAPERKLVDVEKISIIGNFDRITRRYLDISQVDVEGIKITIDGVDAQKFVPDNLWLDLKNRMSGASSEASEMDWSLFLSDNPAEAAEQLLKQFETSKLASEIEKRWPNEIKQFDQTSGKIETHFHTIKELFDQSKTTPDKVMLANRILQELEGVNIVFQQLLGDVAEVKNKAENDYQQLAAATQRDKIKIQGARTTPQHFDGLSASLIGPEVREQWENILVWSDWARSLLLPAKIDETAEIDKEAPFRWEHFGLKTPRKFRGEMIHFAALEARPDLQIDNMNLTGEINFGGIPVFFNGMVKNIAHSMRLAPQPTVANFCFSGVGVPASPFRNPEQLQPTSPPNFSTYGAPGDRPISPAPFTALPEPNIVPEFFVEVSVDRVGTNDSDRLIVHCPAYRLTERLIGDPKKFAIAVSPGLSRLDGVILLKGLEMTGQFRIIQTETRLAAVLPEKLYGKPIHAILQQTLDSLNGFTAEIQVSGTRSDPVYTFKSDIADRLQPQLEAIAKAQWEQICSQADNLLVGDANQAIEVLNSILRDKIDPTVGNIKADQAHWQQQLAQGLGQPLNQLLQTQVSRLSEKDQQRLGQFLQSPAIQGLLNQSSPQNPGTETTPGNFRGTATPQQVESNVDRAIQEGVEKIQEKLPGLLDSLRNRRVQRREDD